MNLFRKWRIAKEAIRAQAERDSAERAKKLIEAGELNVELIQKFIESIPFDVEVRVYPAGGGQITITRQRRSGPVDDFRPWDYLETINAKKAVGDGPKR